MNNLQKLYIRRAYRRLGIRPADWEPGMGYHHNRALPDEPYYYHYYQ
ncbi:MAG: hypothetical protein ABIX01_09935 [Chitinophagaceae bacterium]